MAQSATDTAPSMASAHSEPHKTVASALGEIAWLMTQSPTHKHFAIADLEWLVIPALLLKQCRIFYDGQRPVACALWGFLSPETEQRLSEGVMRIRPDEWKAENGKPWLVDAICPFDTADGALSKRVVGELAGTVFQGGAFRTFQMDPKTGARKAVELKIDAASKPS